LKIRPTLLRRFGFINLVRVFGQFDLLLELKAKKEKYINIGIKSKPYIFAHWE